MIEGRSYSNEIAAQARATRERLLKDERYVIEGGRFVLAPQADIETVSEGETTAAPEMTENVRSTEPLILPEGPPKGTYFA